MSKLTEYARNELDRLMSNNDDGMQSLMNQNILDLIEMFSEHGHSGFSASYLIHALQRLMKWKPLQPLTGEDDEWNECGYTRESGATVFQNKRCSSVFKDVLPDGTWTAHDIDSVVCSDNGGITWFSGGTTKQWMEDITFPYLPPVEPKRVYIEYTEEVPVGFTGDKFDIITDDEDRIKTLYEKKRKEFDDN